MQITPVFIICCALLEAVTSTPQKHKASDGREYLIETELKYNWFQAWNECARRDSQLVIIDTEAKNNAIIDLLKNVIGKSHNLWLGGTDEFSSSHDYNRPFFWSATGKQFTFTFWADNNPDNDIEHEHCVHIWDAAPLYQWNDIYCTLTMGYICEQNHYLESYNKDLKQKCDAVKQSSSSIFFEFDQAQKQQLSQINSKIQNIDRVGDEWKIEMQQLQNATQLAVQKILDDQQVTVKEMTEKMLKQVNDLNGQLKKSTTEINSQFGQKLNGSFSFPMTIQNLIVIKQGA